MLIDARGGWAGPAHVAPAAPAWLPMGADGWADCTNQPGRESWRQLPYLMRGRQCTGALDVGLSCDLSSLCLCFPPRWPGEHHTYLWWFWLPESSPSLACPISGGHLRAFRDADCLIMLPGEATAMGLLVGQVLHLLSCFEVRSFGVDPYNSAEATCDLKHVLGSRLRFIRQSFLGMSSPAKTFIRQVQSGTLEHGEHPVARWMAGGTAVETDPAGNIRPLKRAARSKIDGIVAAIMALGCAMDFQSGAWR